MTLHQIEVLDPARPAEDGMLTMTPRMTAAEVRGPALSALEAPAAAGGVRWLDGRAEIRAELDLLDASCLTERMAMVADLPPVRSHSVVGWRTRGVRARTIHQVAPLSGRAFGTDPDQEETRAFLAVSATMVIADRLTALVIQPPVETDGALSWRGMLIEDTRLVGLLCEMYDGVWECSLPFGADETPQPRVEELTERQECIGRLLATGAKDEAIARRLGLSLRTVRAEISRLTEALGARSRFQAGVQLARRYG
ncbi:helix-turn-helix transcriptional regulator [Kribbella deserti]|uniref:LuxR C-terminal-related transcriptional regulator n=1 Tax=Kribbella deserti TaxID=1926257 RepID=A0ABV6QMP8_9ACTN